MDHAARNTLYTELAPGLRIARIITGLWQIADMERGQASVALQAAAHSMQPYVDAGLATFDMADHYGSAEDIAGLFREHCEPGEQFRVLTKWVPDPGGFSAATVHALRMWCARAFWCAPPLQWRQLSRSAPGGAAASMRSSMRGT